MLHLRFLACSSIWVRPGAGIYRNTKKFSEPETAEVSVEHLNLASWVGLSVGADLAAAQLWIVLGLGCGQQRSLLGGVLGHIVTIVLCVMAAALVHSVGGRVGIVASYSVYSANLDKYTYISFHCSNLLSFSRNV